MAYEYRDAYLKKFCSYEIEQLAIDYVNSLGTFTTAWIEKLAIVRAYILVCMENQANDDDTFAVKLKTYNKEFDALLVRAQTASADEDGNYAAIFSVPLERG